MSNEIIKGCKFHHVSINVRNFEKSIQFYKILGMPVYLEFDIDDGERHAFIDVGDGPYLEIHSTKEKNLSDGRMQHFCFHVEDVDSVYELALKNGATPKDPPFSPRDCPLKAVPKPLTKARVAHFIGPDGENIELINWFGFKI